VLGSRQFEKRLVSIDAEHVSMWSDSLRNARGNRAGAAANIKHRESWLQKLGKAAMVSLRGTSAKDSRIRPV
jgi:hypothetical protein